MNKVINDIYEQVAGGEENLSQVERWTSMLGGVVLAAAGLRRGGVQGAVMGVAGGLLAGVAHLDGERRPFAAALESWVSGGQRFMAPSGSGRDRDPRWGNS